MGPVKQLSRGTISERSASLPTRDVHTQRPTHINMPRQHSFRCLDAMLADSRTGSPTTPPYSPSSPAKLAPDQEQVSTPTSDTERAGTKLRQLFRKKTPSPQPVAARESFFCADAQAVEEAYLSSRDRYEAASQQAAAQARPSLPASLGHSAVVAPAPALREAPARNLMAEALAQRAKEHRAATQVLSHGRQVRPPRHFVSPSAPPPVPPLPEQYRRRDTSQRA